MAYSSSYIPTFHLAPGEEWVTCPYNFSHQITSPRYLTHLDKCRRNYLKECQAKGIEPEIVSCRFNDMHRVHKQEIDSHQKTCPDQYRTVQHVAYHSNQCKSEVKDEEEREEEEYEGAGRKKGFKRLSKAFVEEEEEEEDWDEGGDGEEEGDEYDPRKVKVENRTILYIPRGLSKSERKKFRDEHLRRGMHDMADVKVDPELKPDILPVKDFKDSKDIKMKNEKDEKKEVDPIPGPSGRQERHKTDGVKVKVETPVAPSNSSTAPPSTTRVKQERVPEVVPSNGLMAAPSTTRVKQERVHEVAPTNSQFAAPSSRVKKELGLPPMAPSCIQKEVPPVRVKQEPRDKDEDEEPKVDRRTPTLSSRVKKELGLPIVAPSKSQMPQVRVKKEDREEVPQGASEKFNSPIAAPSTTRVKQEAARVREMAPIYSPMASRVKQEPRDEEEEGEVLEDVKPDLKKLQARVKNEPIDAPSRDYYPRTGEDPHFVPNKRIKTEPNY